VLTHGFTREALTKVIKVSPECKFQIPEPTATALIDSG
jgi:hypothetical protein